MESDVYTQLRGPNIPCQGCKGMNGVITGTEAKRIHL